MFQISSMTICRSETKQLAKFTQVAESDVNKTHFTFVVDVISLPIATWAVQHFLSLTDVANQEKHNKKFDVWRKTHGVVAQERGFILQHEPAILPAFHHICPLAQCSFERHFHLILEINFFTNSEIIFECSKSFEELIWIWPIKKIAREIINLKSGGNVTKREEKERCFDPRGKIKDCLDISWY